MRSFIPGSSFLCLVALLATGAAADKPKDRGIDAETESILAQFKSKEVADRLAAAEALAKKGEAARGALRPICEVLAAESNERVRLGILEALDKIRPDVAGSLTTLFVDKDAGKKWAAVRDLAKQGAAAGDTLPALYPLLKSLTELPKAGVADGLACLDLAMSIDAEDEVTWKLLNDLANSGGASRGKDEKVSTLNAVLATRQLQKYAVDQEKYKEKAIAKLTAMLGHPADKIRVAALTALTTLGADARTALPAIKKLKFDPSEEVRQAAKKATDAIDK